MVLFSSASWPPVIVTAIIYAMIAGVVIRFGLLALASAIFIDGIIGDMPFTVNTSAWYFGTSLLLAVFVVGLITWAFREAIAGQTLFRSGLPD
jgi:hypothetical protein